MNDFCALRQEEGNPNVSLTDFLSEIALLTDQDSDKADDGKG
jgi:DNA helicase-2/ATP-dependent DNA helicase PcrA